MEQFHEALGNELSPYFRALAWWHAIPQPPPPPGKSKKKPMPTDRRSRMKMRIDAGGELDLPDIDSALLPFVGMLFDAGPTSAAGMGMIPLTWTDLEAWQRGTGVFLPPWQLRLLRKLSAAYLAESQTADEHDAPPPWQVEMTDDRRTKVASHIRNVFRGA